MLNGQLVSPRVVNVLRRTSSAVTVQEPSNYHPFRGAECCKVCRCKNYLNDVKNNDLSLIFDC